MELKKCPFCGGEPQTTTYGDVVQCKECAATVFDDKEAITKWNSRVDVTRVVAVVHEDKSITLEPEGKEIDTQEDADIKNTKPLSEEDKGMLMHDITNILADNFCTIEDAEDILNGTLRGICVTSRVERLKW